MNAGQELVPRYDQCQESKDDHWKQAVSQKAAAAVQAKRLRLWILSASHVIHYQPHHNTADYAPAQNDAKMQLACLQGACMHGLLLSNRVVANDAGGAACDTTCSTKTPVFKSSNCFLPKLQ